MKIAQIAPLIESVPPKLYGGTERIVSYLTEELVHLGHDVTLFATGDSSTAARLVPCAPRALRLGSRASEPLPYMVLQLEEVRRRADQFDLLHFHVDLLHYPVFRSLKQPVVTTLHGRLDSPDLVPLYREFRDLSFVSISDAQRTPLPDVNWLKTVYHGMPLAMSSLLPNPQADYLAFVGRISPEKRPDRAIGIAKQAGIQLRIAAKVDPADRGYYEREIEPLLDHPLIDYVGEIGDEVKNEFIGNALALLFPIDWPEPFGLVMIEAMAVGTPVIAYRAGSVPEIIDEGVSGFVVDNEDQAVAAVRKAAVLDRAGVRERFVQRFTAERMARDYCAVYQSLVAQNVHQGARRSVAGWRVKEDSSRARPLALLPAPLPADTAG
jgi:glycosyltransferase involved in cell wall biosynthesis